MGWWAFADEKFYGDNSWTQIHSAFYTAPHAHGPRSSQVRFLRGKYCYVTYFRHTLSHLVTHHMTSYFVYYFVQVLFRGLPSFRTMSPCLFFFPFRPVALLPTLAAPFILRAFGTWLHFQCNLNYRSSAFLRYSL